MRKTFLFFLVLFCGFFYAQTDLDNFKKLSETKPDNALKVWENLYEKQNEADRIYTLMYVSQAYMLKGDQKNMLGFLERAETESASIDNPTLKSELLLRKSGSYGALNLYSNAEKYGKEGLIVASEIKNTDDKNKYTADFNYQLGLFKILQNGYIESILPLKNALGIYEKLHLKEDEKSLRISGASYNLATAYFNVNKLDSAEIYYNKVLNLQKIEANNPFIYFSSLNKMGGIKYQENKIDESLNFVTKSAHFLKKSMNPELSENYYVTAMIYQKKRDAKNAKKYFDLKKEFDRDLNANQIKGIETAIDLLEKNKLKAENKANRLKMISISTIIGFSLLFVLFYFYKNQKRRKEKIIFQNIIAKLKGELTETNNSSALPINLLSKNSEKEVTNIAELQKDRLIPETAEKEILQKLNEFEKSEEFTNPKLSLSLLASQFSTNNNYLSEVINMQKGKNFNAYINELRIHYILNKIRTNPGYLNYKIAFLAEDCGLSYTVFTSVFKNITGLTPGSFIKLASEKNHPQFTNN